MALSDEGNPSRGTAAAPEGLSAPTGRIPLPGIFSGGGHTLGSDEVASTFIADPNAPASDGGMLFAAALSTLN